MSSGFIVALQLRIPHPQWEEFLAFTPNDFVVDGAWPNEQVEPFFEVLAEGDDTFEQILANESWLEAPVIKDKVNPVIVSINSGLDVDSLFLAGTAPRLLLGALRAKGSGELVIHSDGTAEDPGWKCEVNRGKLITRPLTKDEMWNLVAEATGAKKFKSKKRSF
jgi:hypothetical protein